LASVPLDASEAQVAAVVRTYGQMLFATAVEIAAGTDAVLAALHHPVMRAARDAGPACRRETPVLFKGDDGGLVEGVLDLAFRTTEDARPVWVVVDYKTDAEVVARREEYENQIRMYAWAVGGATGEQVRGVLLRV
jgi:ATP-dependent exoDNAse (exonuclease V) beta subunit